MANPSKKKGTAEETAVVRAWQDAVGAQFVRRTSPGTNYDVLVDGNSVCEPIEALVTRPDRGQRLYTLREADFISLVAGSPRPVHIEVKRYARFALHTIFEKKFPPRAG